MIAGPLGALTVRGEITPNGIQIQIPTPRRTTIRTKISASSFAENARKASHLEAVIAVASLIEPAALEQALALVIETCEEAYDPDETADRSDALTWIVAAIRGTIAP